MATEGEDVKTMDELTNDEVEQLTTCIIDTVADLLPKETIFVIVLGGHRNHRATLTNVPPEMLHDVLQKAETFVGQHFTENN